ncbi:MAG: ATP-binding protein, partial [Cyanobacteria bacterium J06626_18]
VASKTPHLKELQALVRQSPVLKQCPLLQDLKIVAGTKPTPPPQAVQDHILNLMKTQSLIGLVMLVENTRQKFADLSESTIEQVIQTLCQENRLQILDPNADRQGQLICHVPK